MGDEGVGELVSHHRQHPADHHEAEGERGPPGGRQRQGDRQAREAGEQRQPDEIVRRLGGDGGRGEGHGAQIAQSGCVAPPGLWLTPHASRVRIAAVMT